MCSVNKKINSKSQTQLSSYTMCSPTKSILKFDDHAPRNSVHMSKNKSHSKKNQSLSKSYKCKNRGTSSFSCLIKDDKTLKKGSRGRLSSNYSSSKQFLDRSSKITDQKVQKYILNSFKQSKNRPTLTIKPRNSVKSSHNKSYSNQTVIRNTTDQKNNLFFDKTSNVDTTKIKKKKHDYIKRFNKTSCLQKSMTTGFHSLGAQLNQTINNCTLSKFHQNYTSKNNLNSSKQNNQEFKKLKSNHQKQLIQIKINTNNLFKKIKSPQRAKLSEITTGYEKIVSDLYNVLNKKVNFSECDLSRIDTNKNDICEKENKVTQESNVSLTHNIKNGQKNEKNKYKMQQNHIIPTQSQSQHWDSYLDFNQIDHQQQSKKLRRAQSQKNTLVKKLNLGQIKKQPIKQYHEEFMQMKQFFSDSWKRQLNEQRKF